MSLRKLAREIVLQRALVVAVVTAAAHVGVVYGLLPDTAGEAAVEWTGRLIDLIGIVGGVYAVRAGVTPADPALAPLSKDGRPLHPADTL